MLDGTHARRIFEILNEPMFTLGDTHVSLMTLIGLSLSLAFTFALATLARRALMGVLERAQVAPLARAAIARAVYLVILTLGVLLSLDNMGIELKSLLTAGALLTVGIGLGIQQLIQSLVNGLVLLLERPIKVGDIVDVDGQLARVEVVGKRVTRLVTPDNVALFVPNTDFVQSRVTNHSTMGGQRRFRIPIGVAYSCDPGRVRQVLLEAADSQPKLLKTPPPQILFTSHGDNALEFEVQVWLDDVWNQRVILSELRFAIDAALRREGIEIPFPQRDLHLRSIDGTAGILELVDRVRTRLRAPATTEQLEAARGGTASDAGTEA